MDLIKNHNQIIYTMKTSKKLLIAVAGFMLIYLVMGLILLRNDVQSFLEAEKGKYSTLEVGNFKNLNFSAHWNATIRKGNTYKVEVLSKEKVAFQPVIKNVNGILYLKVATKNGQTPEIHTRIVMPAIQAITAVGKSIIRLQNFNSDSLKVDMAGGGTFIGKGNKFNKLSFKTSGDSNVQIIKE